MYVKYDYQFNFLSKRLSVITHRKKWLILVKSPTGKCHTFFCEPVLKAIQHELSFRFWAAFFTVLVSQLFSDVSVLNHPGGAAWACGSRLVFLRRPLGRYTLQVSSRTLVACQRTGLVCVPLKVDTFKIVLHFKAMYVSESWSLYLFVFAAGI